MTDDLASEDGTKVKDIYTKDQRKEYAANLPPSITVKRRKGNGRSIEESAAKPQAQTKGTRKAKPIRPRATLIPRDCVLGITQLRIRAIEDELRSLVIDNHTNAVSVLFRVFIELSVDVYIDAHSLPRGTFDKLRNKLEAVLNDLLSHKKLTAQQASPVRKAMAKTSYLSPSIDLMNDYIHNPNVFPAPGDLCALE